jgi:type IV secretion system protein VirB10
MAKDPLNDIPEAVEEDDVIDEPVTLETPDVDPVPAEDTMPMAEVTKGTPAKDIFGRLMKLIIPALALAGGVWFFMPQEIDAPKERSEAEVNDELQEANTNSMIKHLQAEAEERQKAAAAAENLDAEALAMQSQAVGGKVPAIPVIAGNGTVSGEGNPIEEAAIREGEVRASNLEAAGSFKLLPDAATAIRDAFTHHTAPTKPSAQEILDTRIGKDQQGSGISEVMNAAKANPNEAFLTRQEKEAVEPVFQKEAFAQYLVQQGTVVRTVLVSGINSDLPGAFTAVVTSDVYDSTTGRHLMIPKGAKLIGQYRSSVAVGQDRVLMALNRMILPDGSWISLAGTPGADPIGQSGVEADVDNHFLRMFGAAFMIGAVSLLLPDDQNTISTDNLQGTGEISAGSVTAIGLG